MASRLHALQNKMAEQDKKRDELLAAINSHQAAVDAAATPEEKQAQEAKLKELTAEANTLAVEMKETAEQLKAVKALQDMERTATATAAVRPLTEDDPQRGFESLGAFALAVRNACPQYGGRIDERLLVAQADLGGNRFSAAAPSPLHQETNSSDGFMVPPMHRAGIWKLAFESDDLLAAVNPEPTESNFVHYCKDETTPWGASGIQAYWVGEGKQLTGSKLGTNGSLLQLHKVAALVFASTEIQQDAALLMARINEKAPLAVTWETSEAIMRGDGVQKPRGWEAGAIGGTGVARISIAKETSQAATTLVAKNIVKMYARLLTQPGARVNWLANRDVVPELVDLKIGNEPSWVARDGGLQSAPSGMLMGYPIRFTEHCKTLGTTGDIQLIDFAGYIAFIHSAGTRFDASIHLYFDYDATAFRFITRVGGTPVLSAPVSPANGSNTKSHFVYLDTRS